MNLLILLCKVESKTNHFKVVTLGQKRKESSHNKKTRLVFASINRHHSRVTDRQTVKQKEYDQTQANSGIHQCPLIHAVN